MLKLKLSLLAVAVTILVGGGIPAQAFSYEGEHIENFESVVHITKSGAAEITETIDYDFGPSARHGIYRDIPIDYHDGSNSYYLTFSLQGVKDGSGNTLKNETSVTDGNERIKIGDPNVTLTGQHRYVISYSLGPVTYQKEGRPFLNLDVYGGGWQVPANHFSATVSLDDNAKLSNISWYGPAGVSGSNPTINVENVPAYSPITINANLPDGYTSNFLEANKKRPVDLWEAVKVTLIVLGIIVLVVGSITIVFARWWSARRKRKNQTVIPEYDPPEGMLPAGIGLLEDDTTDAKEITATIIDFAVRGGLKINREESSFLGIKRAKYTLIKGQEPPDLTQAESILYGAIFKSKESVKVKDLQIPVEAQEFRSLMKERLTEKGYYQKSGNIFMRGTLTDEGAKQWAKVDGFKLYLGVTEKDRLKFSDAPDKTPERFNKLLPYAIAFGVEKEWAKQFEGIDVSKSADWYSGGNLAAFSAASLASDLSSSFSLAISSNSSFSSSGGSAGGGVGGGGGGSW